MDLIVLYEFVPFDLFEINKEIEIKGEIKKEKVNNSDLTLNDKLFFYIKISRKGFKFLIEGCLDTNIILQCDRCLVDFSFPVKNDFSFLFIYDKEKLEYIDEHLLNIQDMILSEIFLNIPFKKLCSYDCKGLCPECGENLNINNCNCNINHGENPFAKLKTMFIN